MSKRLRTALAVAMMVTIGGATGMTVNAREANDTQAPSAPLLTTASQTAGGAPSVDLVWNTVPSDQGAVEYQILRNGVTVDAVAAAGSSFDETAEHTVDVGQAGPSWFQVIAVDAAGNESRRSAPLQTWVDVGNPPAPLNVTPSLDYITKCFNLFLTTQRGSYSVADFEVFVNGRSVATIAARDTAFGGDEIYDLTICSDDLLTPGKKYFQVRAVNTAGTSAKSAPVRRDVGRSATPTDFTAVIVGNQVTFTWTAPPSAGDTYVITDALVVVAGPGNGARSITIDLPPSKTGDGRHWFQIKTTNFFSLDSLSTSPIALTE